MTPRERACRVIPAHYEGAGWNQARDRAEKEVRDTWNSAIEKAAQEIQDVLLAAQIRRLKLAET